jgi:predicted nucleotidyltransferase
MAHRQVIDSIKRDVIRFYNIIRKEMPVTNGFLFGSYAKGTSGKSSDIDVGIILDIRDRRDKFKINARMLGFAMDINPDIEPYCVTIDEWNSREPASILNEIAKSAIMIDALSAGLS